MGRTHRRDARLLVRSRRGGRRSLLDAGEVEVGLQSLVLHQTLAGNFPMIVRWLAHRYLLRQSLSFFHDEFAGRIATRMMQTALAVRTTVIKLLAAACP